MIGKGVWSAGAMTDMPPRILLLAGTEEAVRLNRLLAESADVSLITSLAGRTRDPAKLTGDVITGGFGGQSGLDAFLRQQSITHVIDATHPFAAQITSSAIKAATSAAIDYLRLERRPWTATAEDNWIGAASVAKAAGKLEGFRNIFLSIGRQELSAFREVRGKQFLVRSIEPVAFDPAGSTVTFLQDRGPFSMDAERALMKEHRIELVVSKNSGGSATYAKIEAARNLGLPVLMIERPEQPACRTFEDIDSLLQALRLGRST